jgi:uncharacterized protein (DUF1330 family)
MSLILVVTLTVRTDSIADFRAFERSAARIMADHGGQIERTVIVAEDPWREVHLVRFPDAAAFRSYRQDERLQALADQRERAILETTVLTGADGPDYHAEP